MGDERLDGLPGEQLLDEQALSKLRWRCRRGLLENDLYIDRLFAQHESSLTVAQARGLYTLMELADNDLLDLLLSRKEPEDGIHRMETREVLGMLRAGRLGGRSQLAG